MSAAQRGILTETDGTQSSTTSSNWDHAKMAQIDFGDVTSYSDNCCGVTGADIIVIKPVFMVMEIKNTAGRNALDNTGTSTHISHTYFNWNGVSAYDHKKDLYFFAQCSGDEATTPATSEDDVSWKETYSNCLEDRLYVIHWPHPDDVNFANDAAQPYLIRDTAMSARIRVLLMNEKYHYLYTVGTTFQMIPQTDSVEENIRV